MSGDGMLLHATDVVGRPVVTLAGEDVAQVRDVLFDRSGFVVGFTLAGRGLFAGPRREWLAWSSVHGFGPDAVMIASDDVLTSEARAADDGDVVGVEVMTRSGTVIGEVIDAVLRLEPKTLDLVGYEVEGTNDGQPRLVPLPDTIAVTGGRLVVPDEATEFLAADLAGFGAAVDTFRARLRGSR